MWRSKRVQDKSVPLPASGSPAADSKDRNNEEESPKPKGADIASVLDCQWSKDKKWLDAVELAAGAQVLQLHYDFNPALWKAMYRAMRVIFIDPSTGTKFAPGLDEIDCGSLTFTLHKRASHNPWSMISPSSCCSPALLAVASAPPKAVGEQVVTAAGETTSDEVAAKKTKDVGPECRQPSPSWMKQVYTFNASLDMVKFVLGDVRPLAAKKKPGSKVLNTLDWFNVLKPGKRMEAFRIQRSADVIYLLLHSQGGSRVQFPGAKEEKLKLVTASVNQAAIAGCLQILQWFVNKDNILLSYPAALHHAAEFGHPTCVHFLLSQTPNHKVDHIQEHQPYDQDTPMMRAIKNGHLEIVEMLLQAGADVAMDLTHIFGASQVRYTSPRQMAAEVGQHQIVELMDRHSLQATQQAEEEAKPEQGKKKGGNKKQWVPKK